MEMLSTAGLLISPEQGPVERRCPWPGSGPAQTPPQKAPLPVKEARVEVTPARALGERPGITSLMLSGETEPFIMLAAMSS